MPERIVHANGVELCVETFGAPGDPAILLLAGMSSSMLVWEDEFCARLAADRRYVIRFDYRDTGRSVGYPPGAPGYGGLDLAADALALLDELGVFKAHFVGISMGGGLAQLVAADHPERVASLTLISTTTSAEYGDDLPPMTEELLDYFMNAPTPDWSSRESIVDYWVELDRRLAGSHARDDAALRARVERMFERTANYESSMTNHNVMDKTSGAKRDISAITAPTLVLHGTEDPLFPLEHGIYLAGKIPGAELVMLDKVGHELPRTAWDVAVPAILAHVSQTLTRVSTTE
ncbi:Pimeloyl-ACP methyl ester carboxylesterase [Amycolatopsis xylanica]|uniref:Pimeloyl-ACP methyl ester carboxylesterase n=1 Tax=Amycolatopsis xylanica TaxID=589385 RepID=A0A1H2ZTR3_9PSEU|nr:alpha/beta hydrolase [Amycolatopsis xylanica]SDX20980.1 Pimeloyl-ACP methyl ester carboxylesterase [Amycolatopsis xylanica]